jgi:DNA-binding PadR family transcriptional regulator
MFLRGKHNEAELKARVLMGVLDASQGVRGMASTLHIGPSRLIHLLSDMRAHGLLEEARPARRGRGRPRRALKLTPLGRDYLRAWALLESSELRATAADLLRAASDGRYARRLSDRGHSTAELFLELNQVAIEHR